MQRPPLTRDEIAHLDHEAAPRERLVLRLLYETGCTVSELCKLRTSDFKEGLLHIGKRRLKLTDLTRQFLLKTCPARRVRHEAGYQYARNASSFLFTTRESTSISPRRVEQLLATLGKRVLGSSVTPQQLRATRISHDIEAGLPIAEIERKVGLQSLGPHLYRHAKGWQS